ncbi:hypothetical protein ACFOWU_08870 [Epilithonimonas zeae]|uniref:Tetratricopeptide repeat protein n=1 Tax=Epilithonimonas zeae TaxID=1416779 RepID=A0A1N6GHL1_9FLAO|nr:hypothetical protein [Epilithonimonas zeae]SIO07030.1 hypothetical protein SAMN05444409_1855 [Epilithonimonas zeae]
MKRFILITMLFFGFFGAANEPTVDVILTKAQKLMLQNPIEAFRLAKTAFDKKNLSHEQKLQSLFILTNTSNMLQKPLDVIKYGNKALDIADDNGDAITKVKILGILGNTYQSLQLNEKTRVYLDQAEALLSSPKISDTLSMVKGNIFYLKAMNYFYSLDSGIAISYFNKAINQYLQSKNPLAEINIKMAYLNKGFSLIQQKQTKLALENLNLASINMIEASNRYPPQFVELQQSFIELGKAKILALENKPDLSNVILFEILKQRKNQVARDDIENDIYALLSKNFLQQKDIKNHHYYESVYKKRVAESNLASAKLVNQLILQEESNSALEKQSINKNYILLIIFTATFFTIIIVFMLIKTVRKEQIRRVLRKEATRNI